MSDLRELRDTVERVFKQVCRLSAENNNLARLQGDLGDIFGRLAWAAAEQEALSPAQQNTGRAERLLNESKGYEWYEDKGSSVEYYKDRLVEAAIEFKKYGVPENWQNLVNTIDKYQDALSASPDPAGSWEWVPKGFVIAPEAPTDDMARAAIEFGFFPSLTYRNMLAARPPVPKKGERV